MESTVLNEHESACRAAHEQVQLLQHLYGRLADSAAGHARDGESDVGSDIDSQGRISELREDRQLLVAKLKNLGLLRTEPDPERESLLELATGIRRALGASDDRAVNQRLETEEREYLRLCEQLVVHDEDERIAKSIDRTKAAIERLE